MNRTIAISKIKFLIKNFEKEFPGLDGFTKKFYQL